MTIKTKEQVPPLPPPPREPLTKMEETYLRLLVHWYKHSNKPPTLHELASRCRPRKSTTAVRAALLCCESKGYVTRNDDGRFMVVP